MNPRNWPSAISNSTSRLCLRLSSHSLEMVPPSVVVLRDILIDNFSNLVLGVHAMNFEEGEYNKVFLLRMDNGHEAIAKLPNPNAGPPHYTTASEIATVDFVRCLAELCDKSTDSCSLDQFYNSQFPKFLVGALRQRIPSALNILSWKRQKGLC